jgi:hypothetical protein
MIKFMQILQMEDETVSGLLYCFINFMQILKMEDETVCGSLCCFINFMQILKMEDEAVCGSLCQSDIQLAELLDIFSYANRLVCSDQHD